MATVYLLEHLRDEDDERTSKNCGIYSSREEARSAIQRLVLQPGFKDFPNGFSISEYVLDRIYWAEGFGVEDYWP